MWKEKRFSSRIPMLVCRHMLLRSSRMWDEYPQATKLIVPVPSLMTMSRAASSLFFTATNSFVPTMIPVTSLICLQVNICDKHQKFCFYKNSDYSIRVLKLKEAQFEMHLSQIENLKYRKKVLTLLVRPYCAWSIFILEYVPYISRFLKKMLEFLDFSCKEQPKI